MNKESTRPKTCSTCAHRSGSIAIGYATCTLSGYYISTERKYPLNCGKNYEKWVQREPLLERIKYAIYKK